MEEEIINYDTLKEAFLEHEFTEVLTLSTRKGDSTRTEPSLGHYLSILDNPAANPSLDLFETAYQKVTEFLTSHNVKREDKLALLVDEEVARKIDLFKVY